ncbi:hypothetical protein AB5I41_04265 [Sphingomonas sp. MMS24-JH45]
MSMTLPHDGDEHRRYIDYHASRAQAEAVRAIAADGRRSRQFTTNSACCIPRALDRRLDRPHRCRRPALRRQAQPSST